MNKKVKKSRLPLLLHLLSWFVLIILPQIIISMYWGERHIMPWDFYLNIATFGSYFYFIYLLLVPKLYFRENKTAFFVAVLITAVAFFFIINLANNLTHVPERERRIADAMKQIPEDGVFRRPPFRLLQLYTYSLITVVLTGFSIGLRIIEKHSASEKRQKELEKEKLHSELAFLKNQVSPHFFFNTLNNIYSLIEVNTTDAQDAVMKLSRMMRYLLYESEQGKTPLSHEIKFMKHYIDLMRLRLSSKVELDIQFPEEENNKKIPPLLFIPFIENAFKHGISYREKSFIHIFMKIDESQIQFSCKNSIGRQTDKEIDENHSGIGLENVKKRLNLLFPSKHNLDISQSEQNFTVQLEINLTE